MMRFTTCLLCFSLAVSPLNWLYAQIVSSPENATDQNLIYELLINGEPFFVEGNRVVVLRSKRNPNTEYEIAIRVSPTQQYRMPNLLFSYDRPASAERDKKDGHDVVRLVHELGYTMLIHDLGGTLDEAAQRQALDILAESLAGSFGGMQARDILVGKPYSRKFSENSGLGTMIRYRDEQGLGHTCLVYVLAGKGFSATCIIQYLDHDQDDVLPLIRKTLDSFRAKP